jgi:hypothetical protein
MAITRVSTQGLTRSGTAIADVPDIPSIGAISDPGTDGYATVAFTAAATGGSASSYIATSTPGSITGSSSTSPITVTGLTLGTSYTFKVKGSNSTATGAESSASSSFTPIAHWAPAGAYDSIATTTVGAGGVSSITFSSIPSTYTHLQLRLMATTPAAGQHNFEIRINSDTGNNYATHQIQGNGSSIVIGEQSSTNRFTFAGLMNPTVGFPFAAVVDFFDYANTNKNKTMRSLAGANNNAADTQARVGFSSGLWMNTNAITTISLVGGDYGQYTIAALYGIKGN